MIKKRMNVLALFFLLLFPRQNQQWYDIIFFKRMTEFSVLILDLFSKMEKNWLIRKRIDAKLLCITPIFFLKWTKLEVEGESI